MKKCTPFILVIVIELAFSTTLSAQQKSTSVLGEWNIEKVVYKRTKTVASASPDSVVLFKGGYWDFQDKEQYVKGRKLVVKHFRPRNGNPSLYADTTLYKQRGDSISLYDDFNVFIIKKQDANTLHLSSKITDLINFSEVWYYFKK
jgi:hypothetical protein